MKQEITNNRLATMPISDGTLTKEKLISMRIDMQEQLKENERVLTSNISSIGGLVNRMREAEKNKAEQLSTLPPTSHPAIKQEVTDGFQENIASPVE